MYSILSTMVRRWNIIESPSCTGFRCIPRIWCDGLLWLSRWWTRNPPPFLPCFRLRLSPKSSPALQIPDNTWADKTSALLDVICKIVSWSTGGTLEGNSWTLYKHAILCIPRTIGSCPSNTPPSLWGRFTFRPELNRYTLMVSFLHPGQLTKPQ